MQNTFLLASTKKIFDIAKKLIKLLYLKIKYRSYQHKLIQSNSEIKRVLFFLPELSVPLYFDLLVAIARNINENGYQSAFFGCNGFLHNCLFMDRTAKRYPTLKSSIFCANCSLNGEDAVHRNGFDYIPCSRKNSLVSFQNDSVNARLQYVYKGVPVGKLAYYDLSIKFKRDRSRDYLTEKEIAFYDSVISDGVVLIDFLDESFQLNALYAVVAIDEYCHANIVREWARLNKISSFRAGFSYHFNADPQFVTLSKEKTRASEKCKRADDWRAWKTLPLPSELVREISSDLIFRMSSSGGHIFSANYSGNIDSIIANYRLCPDKRTLVVFTSANDEIDALTELSEALGDNFEVKDAFKNQLDWLTYIIDYAKNHDIQLIVKMHPRLSSSHRDYGDAEDIHLYEKLFESAPDNVAIVWPKDNVSAYDILQLADVCLTSWGTMGLEAAKLGVPVVSGITRITFATPQLALFSKAETIDHFKEMISQPREEIFIDDIVEAYRWHHLLHFAGSIFLDGARDLKLYQQEFDLDFCKVLEGKDVADEKYKFLLEQVRLFGNKAYDDEMHAMVNSIESLLDFFNKGTTIHRSNSRLVYRLNKLKQSVGNRHLVKKNA